MATHTGEMITDPTYEMYAGDTFDSCTFTGTARKCNFSQAVFTSCTFSPGFKFEDCNLQGADGIESVERVRGSYMTPAEYAEMELEMARMSL